MIDEPQQLIVRSLLVWAVAGFVLFVSSRKNPSTGLCYIWLGDLAINHLFGALIYLVPGYIPQDLYLLSVTAEQTAQGFWTTSVGLLGFIAGAVFVAPLIVKFLKQGAIESQKNISVNLPKQLIIWGAFFYFALKFLQRIPSLGTLSQAGWVLMQVGICLAVRKAYQQNNKKAFVLWLVAGLFLFPAFTLIFQGFMGYGIKVMLIMLCFTSVYYRDKWKLFVAAPLVLWLALSLYVNYMSAREQIRESVWGGAGLTDRVSVIRKAFAEPQGFSIQKTEHLDMINIRLNQNWLVGACVEHLTYGGAEFARGKTLRDAVLAMIPRILWKKKPVIGGSGSLVTDYTGIAFEESTSVGVGLPLELFANFGMTSVVIGFFVVGVLVGTYDRLAGKALRQENIKSFLVYFLPGLAWTVTIGSLMEATSSFAAMYVFLFLINRLVFKNHQRFVRPPHSGINSNNITRF